MAATITNQVLRASQVFGGERVTVTNVAGDASYPTGGYAVTPQQLGLIDAVDFAISSLTTAGAGGVCDAFYNIATGKLQFFGTTGEIANTTNVAAWTAQVVAFGY